LGSIDKVLLKLHYGLQPPSSQQRIAITVITLLPLLPLSQSTLIIGDVHHHNNILSLDK
jgi:hypothetical protein